jgi:hypothetical protein
MSNIRRPWLLNGGKPDRVGRVQTQIRRAFIASGGRPLKIRDLLVYCYPAAIKHPRWRRWKIHCALPKFGVPLGRISTKQGRPMLWAPKDELARLIRKPRRAQ